MNIPFRRAAILATAVSLAVSEFALAQIATDGTLGPPLALTGPNYAIKSDLGRQVGTNLFHSFSTFNLVKAESATFSALPGTGPISNILSRVTGATASNIDGRLISTIAGANLFLINPKGILFGPNASLDLTGSFHASTANYLKLADGGRFDATNPGASNLTMAPPAAFGFLGPAPAPITVLGSSLGLREGGSLSLVGGAINLSGAALRTVAGDIRLVAMGSGGEVPVTATGASLAGMTLAPVTITDRSALVTDSGIGAPPGRIVIRGGQITVAESRIASLNDGSFDAPAVEIAATEDLNLTRTAVASEARSAGAGADLALSGERINLSQTTEVRAEASSSGRGGDIKLGAIDSLQLISTANDTYYSELISRSSAGGRAGAITATADSIQVKSSNIYTETKGSSDAGPITLRGRSVEIIDGTWVFSQAWPGATGRGADIELSGTQRVFVGGLDWGGFAASVFTDAYGAGDAGNIRMSAPEVSVTGGFVFSRTYGGGNTGDIRFDGNAVRFLGGNGMIAFIDTAPQGGSSGNGGDIEVHATSEFEVSRADYPNGWTRLSSSAFSSGHGGNIVIESPSIIVADGASLWTQATDSGSGGGITLRGGSVRVRDGGELHTHTSGSGDAGHINISGREFLLNRGRFDSYTVGSGNAGDMNVAASDITVRGANIETIAAHGSGNTGSIRLDGEYIRFIGDGDRARAGSVTASNSSGNGGNIVIRASRAFELNGTAVPDHWTHIVAATEGSGRGGEIIIDAPSILIDRATVFSRTRFGTGAQGDITVRADEIRLQHEGGIGSLTEGRAKGSAVRIDAESLLLSDTSGIGSNATSTGDAGTIVINARRVKLTGASSIDVSAVGGGSAGDIVLNIGELFEMSDRKAGTYLDLGGGGPRGKTIWPGSVSSRADGTSNAGNVFLRAPTVVLDDGRIRTNVTGSGSGGKVEIRADNLVLKNGGQVDARAAASSSGDAGSIDISVAHGFEISGHSRIDGAFSGLYTETLGSGRGGNIGVVADSFVLDRGLIRSTASASGGAGAIRIRAGEVAIVNGGWIDAGTAQGSSGAGGSIDIAADRSLLIRGIDRSSPTTIVPLTNLAPGQAGTPIGREQGAFPSTISSNSSGAGSGGNVTLSAPQISIEDGGRVSGNSTGTGNAGNILIDAPQWLKLSAGAVTTQAAISDGGNVTFNAPQITIDAGAQVSANSTGPGSAGNISVQAPEWLKLSGGSITTQAEVGAGGDITLNAPQITVDAGAQVSANSSGPGSAGTILIDAPQWFNLSGSSVTTQAAMGAGGNITLYSPHITIDAGGTISANSSGAGNAGSILVQAPAWFKLSGGSVTTQAEIGDGGDITLNAPQITINAGGQVSASSSGAGNAGNILIQAPEWLKLSDSSITTQAASGDGGNIVILAGNRVHQRNAEISTSVGSGEGSGGNIFIDPTFVILESSRITANAFGGAGGNISIITDHLLASPDSVIDASSQLGISGSVQIAGLRTNPNAALAQLPSALFDASALLREACSGRAGPRASSLVAVGRGGLADAPEGFSASRYFTDTSLPLAEAGGATIFSSADGATASSPSVLLSAICGRNG